MSRTQKPTPLNVRAISYMAKSMAMSDLEEQEQNWILGHLVSFAAAELRRFKKAFRHRLDEAIVGIDRSGANSLKPRDRAPFKGGALWAIVNVRKDVATVQLVSPKSRKRRARS